MNFWTVYFNKAIDNIELSYHLFDQKKFGLAAFHAQQGLEIAIKSFCYSHKIDEYFASKNALKNHLPSSTLIQKFFDYVIDQDNSFNRRNRPPEIESEINNTLFILENLQKIFDKLKNHKPSPIKQVWKYSLNIESNDSQIKQLLEEISDFAKNSVIVEICENMTNDIRKLVIKKMDTRNLSQKQEIKNKLYKKMEKLDLNTQFIDSILEPKSEQWKSNIQSLVIKHGPIRAFDMFFGDESLFSDITKNKKTKKKLKKTAAPLRWLGWIATVCPSVIFAMPHEQIGRYPVLIEGKNSEIWYDEKQVELKKIIEDCEFGIKRIREMI